MSPMTSQRRASTLAEHLDPGLHRTRVRVVRVVDDPGATRRGFELQSARNRAHCGKPRAHVVERRAGGDGRGGGAQRVQHVVAAREVQLDRRRARRRAQLEARHEARRRRSRCGCRARKNPPRSRRRTWTPCARVMPRHSAGEFVVGVDHRGGRRRRARRPSRLRRARRLRGCRSLRDAPRRRS